MKWFFLALVTLVGCDSTDIGTGDGDGNVTIIVEQCSASNALNPNSDGGVDGGDLPGVVATCDDQKPCTVDIQCTPCSAVPESIRHIKATCTNDWDLSPFCKDSMTGALIYYGCTHFIADPTPPGTINSCFPVAFPDDPNSEVHPGVCNQYGFCVENPDD